MTVFIEDKRIYPQFLDLPGAVYTRSGVQYQQTAAGLLVPFDENMAPYIDGVGLGVWEAATNLLLQSGRMDNAAWSKISGATVALVAGAPDGTASMAKVTGGGINSSRIQQSVSGLSAAAVYSGSVHLAYDSAPSSRVAIYDGAVGTQLAAVNINWTGGVPSLGTINGTFAVAPALVQLGTSGIWQLTYGVNSGAFTSLTMLLYPDYTAGLNSTKFWGAEFKLGSYVTPYVATTSAAATRGAASAYLNAPGVIVPALGVTVVAEVEWPSSTVVSGIFVEPYSSGIGYGFSLSTDGTGAKPRLIVRQGSARKDSVSGALSISPSEIVRIAVTFTDSESYLSAKGQTVASVATPSQSDYGGGAVYIGSRMGASNFANTNIRSVQILPGLRTQAQLNALTA